MRLPAIAPLMSRDGTFNKDSHMVNCYAEIVGDKSVAVKRPGLLEAYDLSAGTNQGMVCWNGTLYVVRDNNIYQGPTSEAVANGASWSSIADPDNTLLGTCVHNSELWAFFATGNTYKCTDGATWTTVTTSSDLVEGQSMKFASLGGYIYAIQNGQSDTYLGYVWKSSDGITWTQVTASAGFGGRKETTLLVFNSKLWVIAGVTGVSTYKNDVWYSSDGNSWTQATAAAAFSARWRVGACSHAGKMWIAGGYDGADKNDVYYSADGATWTQATASAGWSGRGNPCLVSYNNRLFTYGSFSGATDVWYSITGATWTQATSNAGWNGTRKYGEAVLGTFFAIGTDGTSWKATINSGGGYDYVLSGTALPINFTSTSAAAGTEYLVVKNTEKAWVLTFGSPGTLTQITDGDYPSSTVPGIAYLDGYFAVMDVTGTIFNSDLEDPLSWNSINYTSAEVEPDAGIAIAKHQNYIVAFKDRTIELFYDAANPSGSPFSTMSNTALQIGCANGYSIASVDGGLFFMSKTSSQNRSVHYFPSDALTPVEVADENVQRILNAATLTTVRAWAGRLSGHAFYALNLVTSGVTLVYDLTSKIWAKWTLQTAAAPITLTSLTQSNGIATANKTAHGQNDGDLVTIAGATPSGYNLTVNITKIDADNFTYPVSAALSTPATGTITATGHTEGYFPFSFFTSCLGSNYVQHETSGKIYEIAGNHTDDDGTHIDARVRTTKFDSGDTDMKTIGELAVVGDKVSGNVLVRYSDDDYESWSKYRPVDMSLEKPRIRRLGRFRRRAFEIRYTGDTRLRVAGLDIEGN